MKRSLVFLLALLACMTAPAQSITVTDANIQLRPDVWKMHNPTDGSQIGGVQPVNYGTFFEPAGTAGMQMYVEGPAWATMMTYTQRPLYFNQPTSIKLEFDVTELDTNGALLESDLMVTVPNGTSNTQFNMSLQDLFSTGQLMNVNGSGAWLNIPNAKPGPLSIGTHHYAIVGGWNLAANTYGLSSVSVDGTAYPVTQISSGHTSTWAPGVNIQFQISNKGSVASGTRGATSVIIDHVTLTQTQ